jgi:hypothetical protein
MTMLSAKGFVFASAAIIVATAAQTLFVVQAFN